MPYNLRFDSRATQPRRWLLPLALMALLSGCGGGGSDSTIAPPPTTYDLAKGISGMVTKGLTASLDFTGMLSGAAVTGTGTLNAPAAVTVTFNGSSALGWSQVLSATISDGTHTAPYATNVVDVYDPSTYALLGEVSSNEFDVASAPIDYPTMVMTGSSGTLGTMSRYTDNTMGVSLGTVQLSYQVKAPASSGGLAVVEFTEKFYDTHQALTETDVLDYSLTTASVMALVSGSAQSGSDTLNFTAK